MSDKQIFWQLALSVLAMGGIFIVVTAALNGAERLIRRLRLRCDHQWSAKDWYCLSVLRGRDGDVVYMAQFKCICRSCKSGKLQDGAIRQFTDGSGEVIFIDKGRVIQSIPVANLQINPSRYPE